MKTRSIRRYGLVPLMAAILLFMGCVTYVWNVAKIPTLQTGSPLRSVEPKTFAFKEFKDIRNVEDPLLLWELQQAFIVKQLKSDQPLTTIVAMQIKKELERNGHKCVVYSPQMKADFVVEGIVYKFSVRSDVGMFTVSEIANTGVKLTISRVPIDSGVFVKSFEGDITTNNAIIALNEALLSMIKEMSTDTELVEFIKK